MQKQLVQDFTTLANPVRAKASARFFKTGLGEYGEGDQFIGLTVPQIRSLVKKYAHEMSLSQLGFFLTSPIHEHRLLAVLVLVEQFQKAKQQEEKEQIYDYFMRNKQWVNNWDIVDSSANKIVGAYIYQYKKDGAKKTLTPLIKSNTLWDRRIAILTTFWFLGKNEPSLSLWVAPQLLADKEDLIHKAVGWMLREVGKRCDEKKLTQFLDMYAHEMPRTMLRYSIERLSPTQRTHYMSLKKVTSAQL